MHVADGAREKALTLAVSGLATLLSLAFLVRNVSSNAQTITRAFWLQCVIFESYQFSGYHLQTFFQSVSDTNSSRISCNLCSRRS